MLVFVELRWVGVDLWRLSCLAKVLPKTAEDTSGLVF